MQTFDATNVFSIKGTSERQLRSIHGGGDFFARLLVCYGVVESRTACPTLSLHFAEQCWQCGSIRVFYSSAFFHDVKWRHLPQRCNPFRNQQDIAELPRLHSAQLNIVRYANSDSHPQLYCCRAGMLIMNVFVFTKNIDETRVWMCPLCFFRGYDADSNFRSGGLGSIWPFRQEAIMACKPRIWRVKPVPTCSTN